MYAFKQALAAIFMIILFLDPKHRRDYMSSTLQRQTDTPGNYMGSHTGSLLQGDDTGSRRPSREGYRCHFTFTRRSRGNTPTPREYTPARTVIWLSSCPSVLHSPNDMVLAPSAMSTCLCNQKPSGTCYSACCLQKTCSFATFPLTGSW